MNNNNNQIITVLQNFEKPEKTFLHEKDCLICLESVDIEAQNIVMLPCKCANSVYHITCISHFLDTGENKNFCPHCKSNYNVEPVEVLIITHESEKIRCHNLLLFFHIVSNSIMNIINISMSDLVPDFDKHFVFKVLLILYYVKLLTNYVIIYYSKQNIEKIQDFLFCSFVFQIVLLGFLIYSLVKLENMVCSFFFLLNNFFFMITDLTIRIMIEYRIRNRVVAL